MESTNNIITKYILLLNEYMQHMVKSEILKNTNNSEYIIYIGLHSIIHIFKIVLTNTKNIDITYYTCQKAYFCYLEYIEQINKSNLIHSLNVTDSITFIYKNSLNNICFNKENVFVLDKTEESPDVLNNSFTLKTSSDKALDSIETIYKPSDTQSLYNQQFENENPEGVSSQMVGDIRPFDESKNLNEIINYISFITTHILFFKSEFNIVLGEHIIYNNTIFMDQINCILNNYLSKFLLLINIMDTKESNKNNFFTLFEYIKKSNHILKFDFDEYCIYLKSVHKILKKNVVIPSEHVINDTFFTLFFIEENRLYIEKMKNEKKMNLVCKALFEFEFT